MQLNTIFRSFTPYFPVAVSSIACILIALRLYTWLQQGVIAHGNLVYVLVALGIISTLIAMMLLKLIFKTKKQLPESNNSLQREFISLTQQVHSFRKIVALLVKSNVWAPGLVNYMEQEFASLNYFKMKEFYKGNSKIAVDYTEKNKRYGDTESLYLEAKSILLYDTSHSKVDTLRIPGKYPVRLLKKWVEHKVGKGLWHYFGFKYPYKNTGLDINRISEKAQDKILNYAIEIDLNRYQDIGFCENLLSQLGEQMSQEVIPRLLELTLEKRQRTPLSLILAYFVMVLIFTFGLLLPLAIVLFSLPYFFTYVAITTVIAMLPFIFPAVCPFYCKKMKTAYLEN